MIDKTTMAVMAALAAAISLLEKGGRRAAPSDKMFDQMILDYKKALADARTHISSISNALLHLSNGAAIFGNDWTDQDELAVMPFNPEKEYGYDLLFTLKVGDFRAISKDKNIP